MRYYMNKSIVILPQDAGFMGRYPHFPIEPANKTNASFMPTSVSMNFSQICNNYKTYKSVVCKIYSLLFQLLIQQRTGNKPLVQFKGHELKENY